METNTSYEQEIDLKDLMFSVLKKWRPILLIAVLFAVLLGGVKAVKGMGSLKDETALAENREAYEADLKVYNGEKERLEREISNIEAGLAEREEYNSQSILMNLNAFDLYKATATYYIENDYVILPGMSYQNPNTAAALLQSYMAIANNGSMYEYILEQMDGEVELNALKELISVSVNSDTNMITIVVMGETKEQAEEIMNCIQKKAEAAREELEETIGTHSLKLVDQSGSFTVDTELAQKQKEYAAATTELSSSLKTKKSELEALAAPAETVMTKKAVLKSAVKYAVLGGVLGAFLVVFFICVAFMMTDKLGKASELRRRYGLMVLGAFAAPERKGVFSFIDRFLDRMDGTEAARMSDGQVFEVAAANAENYLDGAGEVLLAGTVEEADLERVAEGLRPLLSGVTLKVGGNLLKDAGAIRTAAACDAVLFVEKSGKSVYGEIEQEIDRVRSLEKKIAGAIVL